MERYWTALLIQEARHYAIVWVALAGQAGIIFARPRGVVPAAGRATTRPHADATWFMPVHFWAIAAIHRTWWCLSGEEWHRGILTVWAFMEHVLSGFALLVVTIALAFLCERLARHGGMAVRPAQGTLPLSVLPGVVALTICWMFILCCFSPLFP